MSDHKPRKPLAGNAARIAQIRRRRTLRTVRFTVVCMLLVAVLVAYFTGAFGTSLARMGDWVDTVKISMTPGTGFPVENTVENFVDAQPLAGGIALLGQREMVLYAANGNELRRVPHGYDRACITAGDTRVCMYNRAGKQLQVESRTRNLFSQTYQEPILMAEMSKNGTLAVFTQSNLTVYNPLFETVWSWQDLAATPLSMCFASDNRQLAVATLHAEGGALGAKLHFFNIKNNKEIAQTTIVDGIPLQMKYISRSKLLVVFDTFTAIYDTATGEEQSRYDYGARLLQSASLDASKNIVLLFGTGGYTALSNLVMLDTALNETARMVAQQRTQLVETNGVTIQLLGTDAVYTYGMDGTFYGQMPLDARPLALVGAKQQLLITHAAIDVFAPPRRPAPTKPTANTEESSAQSGSSSVPEPDSTQDSSLAEADTATP